MHVKRVCCITPLRSQYQSLHYFTHAMHRALERAGVESVVLDAKQSHLGQRVRQYAPDLMISFNSFLLDPEEVMLCDRLKIPYFSYLVDGAQHYLPFNDSPYLHFSCVDQDDLSFFRQCMSTDRTLFLPHAAAREAFVQPDTEREYDIVLLASYIDCEGMRERWRQHLPREDVSLLETVIDRCIASRDKPYLQLFLKTLEEEGREEALTDLNSPFFATLLTLIDLYIKGLDRLKLVQALAELPIDVFGRGQRSWESAIAGGRVRTHTPLSFPEALSVMSRSRIVLSSFPTFKQGAHERIFYGMAAGALVVADHNPYLAKAFTEGEEIHLYNPHQVDELPDCLMRYLEDEELRLQCACLAQAKVQKRDTWDQRVAQLLKFLHGLS